MEYPFKDLMPLDEVLAREGYYKDWTHLDPEVFYSLTQISEYIKTKGYGVDVRLLIAQLAEHFGLKTTQVVDLGNLLTAKHATLKTQVEQAVAQVNAGRSALETQFNQSVAQMEADKNAVIANATVDSEVILARGGKPTLQARLDDTTEQLAQNANATKFYFKNSKTKMVAHRGAMQFAPENTIPAYELAGQMGYWGVECDVFPSSDGEMFLMHDDTLDRTTNGSGIFWYKTTAEIKQLTVDGGNNIVKFPGLKIPTLDEFLAVCKKWGMVPLVEIKAYHFAWEYDYIVNAIKKAGLEDMSIIISVNWDILRAIRARSKRITLQALKPITEENLDLCLEIGNCDIDAPYADITKEKVELAHSKGLLVNIYIANTPSEKKRMLECGVDMISTDNLL